MNKMPKYLYHYTRIKEDTDKIFLKSQIKFSSPLCFNDPFDSKNPIIYEGNREEKDNYIRNLVANRGNRNQRRAYAAFLRNQNFNKASKKAQEELLHDISVLCLSSKFDDILMFSHYSRNHKGFCLQFEVRKDPNFATANMVCYSKNKKYPKLNRLKDSKEKLLKGSLLVKSWQWKYEKEYRIILNEKEGFKHFESECLTGVIFGCQMKCEDKEQMKGWINEGKHPINLYRAMRSNAYFKLNFEPHDPE